MPLLPGKENIGRNIKEMSKKHPHDQAVAASLEEARRHPKEMARGGKLGLMRPMRLKEPHIPHFGGLFHGTDGGRTDVLHVKVPNNSFIIPADVVGALGENNTLAGAKHLDSIFGSSQFAKNKMMPKFSAGGLVDIVTAAGEYHVLPEQVAKLGNGNIDRGHDILDKFVKTVREKNIQKLKDLEPPKK